MLDAVPCLPFLKISITVQSTQALTLFLLYTYNLFLCHVGIFTILVFTDLHVDEVALLDLSCH